MARPCEYVIVMQPLWKALSLFAAWPQYVSKSGRLVRSPLFSARTVFTAAAYGVTAWRAWVAVVGHFDYHATIPAGDVSLLLLNVQFGLYGLTFFVLNFFLLESRRNAKYATQWQEFQPQFERVCGRSMRNEPLRRAVRVTALALIFGWPPFVVVPLSFAGFLLNKAEVVYLSYATTVLTLASTSWRMHCAFLLHANEMFVDALAKGLRQDSLTRKDAARYMTTWLQLRDLVHAGARSIELTCIVNVFMLTMTIVLCAFNFVYVMLHGFNKLTMFLTFIGILSAVTVVRICNGAHRVNDMLGAQVAMTLAKASTNQFTKEVARELSVFRYVVVASPVRICLLGFLPLDRKNLGALYVTMSTYLVVLVQYSSVGGKAGKLRGGGQSMAAT